MVEKRAAAAEMTAENGRNKEIFSITKYITRERKKQAIGVGDKQGVLRTGTKERLQRWVEHFSEILNRDDPSNPVEEVQLQEIQLHPATEIAECKIGVTKREKERGV